MNNDLLLQKVLSGDVAATKQLYHVHEQYWFGICLRYAHSRTEAQDIFQEGVGTIFNKIPLFDTSKGSFKAWSNKIIVHAALKYLKKHQWQQSFIDLELAAGESDNSANILGSITAKELIELVQQLPSGYRMVFNMREIEGYSHKEIAEILQISVGTSKSQLSKAKKALRLKMKILF
jgi:RNA polymerase sigma-70 factor (ECF subfamily)